MRMALALALSLAVLAAFQAGANMGKARQPEPKCSVFRTVALHPQDGGVTDCRLVYLQP